MKAPQIAVFRLDAGASVGGGHAVRCLALANALAQRAWQCCFAVAESGAEMVRRIVGARHAVTTIPDAKAYEAAALMAVEGTGCALLVIDHYDWAETQEAACRGWASRILVLDDLADRRHDCDVLLDPSLDRKAAHCRRLVPANCRILSGPGFALLREEFATGRMNSDRTWLSLSPTRIFVNFGLVDAKDLTGRTLTALERVGFEGAVDIVLGSTSPYLARVRNAAARAGARIGIHVEPNNLASLMASADLAVGAAGGSAWERCCLGLPSVVAAAASNQEHNARTLEKLGAIELVTESDADLARGIERALARLLQDPPRIDRMSIAAAAVTDGRGAARVALALDPEVTQLGGQVTLRRLTPDDVELTYQWQLHPATRSFARSRPPPSHTEHVNWIGRKLAELGCVLDIIEYNGAPAGVLRLDRRMGIAAGEVCEVSIYIAPELGGRGIGGAALAALRRIAPRAVLIAHVLPENKASHALFSKAGYFFQDGKYIHNPSLSDSA